VIRFVNGLNSGLNNVPLNGSLQDVKIGFTATIDQTFEGNATGSFAIPGIEINVTYS